VLSIDFYPEVVGGHALVIKGHVKLTQLLLENAFLVAFYDRAAHVCSFHHLLALVLLELSLTVVVVITEH